MSVRKIFATGILLLWGVAFASQSVTAQDMSSLELPVPAPVGGPRFDSTPLILAALGEHTGIYQRLMTPVAEWDRGNSILAVNGLAFAGLSTFWDLGLSKGGACYLILSSGLNRRGVSIPVTLEWYPSYGVYVGLGWDLFQGRPILIARYLLSP